MDGIKKKPTRTSMQDMANFLSVTEDYEERSSAPGKKRVCFQIYFHRLHLKKRLLDIEILVLNIGVIVVDCSRCVGLILRKNIPNAE